MDQTSRLALPYLLPNQAQKHVTHNEALRRLDALVQLAVADRDLTAPPASPEEGACWLVGAGASGAWADHDDEIAAWQDGAWAFIAPVTGWRVYVADEALLCVWSGAGWTEAVPAPGLLQNLALLGIGTEADGTNPFAAKLNKALWSAKPVGEGGDGDLRYTLNKEAPGNVLSLLMQSGWSGRAEIGLTGDDDLRVKVSADGASWTEALAIDRNDGRVRFPQGVTHDETGLPVAQYVPSPVRQIWRLDASRPATPRTFTLAGASGTTLTLAAAQVDQIFSAGMQDNVAVRVWNTSKSPAEAAWVDWNLSTTALRVTDGAHIAGWTAGETLRLGDPNPTDDNVLDMIALDISGYLANQLGAVFPQKGVMLGLFVTSSDGMASVSLSADGSSGSAFGGNSLSDGARNAMAMPLPTSVPSPISDSSLVFLREDLSSGASDLTVTFARVLGVYV
jgi:hypothetical protein